MTKVQQPTTWCKQDVHVIPHGAAPSVFTLLLVLKSSLVARNIYNIPSLLFHKWRHALCSTVRLFWNFCNLSTLEFFSLCFASFRVFLIKWNFLCFGQYYLLITLAYWHWHWFLRLFCFIVCLEICSFIHSFIHSPCIQWNNV